jgi:hypothetical protein
MRLGINEFHKFVNGDLSKQILDYYQNLQILSEADLQSIVWKLLTEYIQVNDPKPYEFKVLNKPYLKGLKIHPDIVIFRKGDPWVIIELKEKHVLNTLSATSEQERLIQNKSEFKAKRGYLLYVARSGEGYALQGKKAVSAARYFFEVPIILEKVLTHDEYKKWVSDFKHWSKFSKE